jgi:hypothetical protein
MLQSPRGLPLRNRTSDAIRSKARVVWVKTAEENGGNVRSTSSWQRPRARALTAKLAASGAQAWAPAWGLSPEASPGGIGLDFGCVRTYVLASLLVSSPEIAR